MTPVGADWEITKRCNQTCTFCLNASGPDFMDSMNTYECLSVVDQLADFGVFHVVITGGEPFLRPDIVQILEYAARKNLIWTVTSNGSALNGDTIRRLEPIKSHFRSVQISLHGLSEEMCALYGITAKQMRSTKANIEALVNHGFTTTVICLFNGANEEEVLATYEWCRTKGVFGFISSTIKSSGRAASIKGDFYSPEHKWVSLLRRLFAAQKKSSGPKILISEPPLFQEYANKRLSMDLIKYSCPAGTETFMIKHDGEVYPCPFISPDCTNDETAIRFSGGNIRQRTLADIFAARGFLEFKDNLHTARMIDGKVDGHCVSCGQFKKESCLPCQLGYSACHNMVRATTDVARAP